MILLCAGNYGYAGGLIVNEASNGTSGSKEFYELVVVGDSISGTAAVDLTDWIIDDNNGDWGGGGTGIGTATGHARLDPLTDPANCGWIAAATPGSVILVYNQADPNLNLPIPAIDLSDINADGVYLLPVNSNCIKHCSTLPSSANPAYPGCTATASVTWSKLAMANSGDVAQSRDATGVLYHGFSYGGVGAPFPVFPPYPASSSFNVSATSGSASAYTFSCGSWNSVANFSKIAATVDTPGVVNNAANQIFIDNVKLGVYDYTNLALASNCTVAPALDYGDAPASYGSASHINDATNYLGALIDSDTGDWGNGVDANGNATDDDTVGDPAGGVDDEDGVTLPAMTQGQTVAIPVIVTGAGTLNSWIDWNGDGDFLDVSEQIATDVTDGGAGDTDALANGTIALSITVPVTAATTPTYARFRFGSAGLAASSADILGEVEDYQLVISATPVITLLKSVQIFSDPVNGTTNAKAIPGGVAMYTILATNSGAGTADNIIINDAVPANTAIMVTDIGLPGSGPVAFVDGTAPNLPSGLTYTFTSLADAADSLDFSNDGGTTWTYTPTADPNGLDSAVTDIRVKPTGVYSAASGGNNAVFSILFKVGVQ